MPFRVLSALFYVYLVCVCNAQTKSAEPTFDRKNTWTFFADYSNTSSHLVAGEARQREWVTLGAGYTRRVVRFAGTELGYRLELRPLVFESDPLAIATTVYSGGVSSNYTAAVPTFGVCQPGVNSQTFQEPPPIGQVNVTATTVCGRRWTFGQAFAPFGVRYAMGIRHRVQPFVIGTLGYMYTSRPVPVTNAEAFNFVIDAGAGIEVFRSGRRSLGLETRVHHFSNRGTAPANPGVDNLVYGVSYSFGR